MGKKMGKTIVVALFGLLLAGLLMHPDGSMTPGAEVSLAILFQTL